MEYRSLSHPTEVSFDQTVLTDLSYWPWCARGMTVLIDFGALPWYKLPAKNFFVRTKGQD